MGATKPRPPPRASIPKAQPLPDKTFIIDNGAYTMKAGYASESDSEGQDEQQQPEPQPDHAVVGAETETLADKAVEGQVQEPAESQATLASLARQHGFTPYVLRHKVS